MLLLITEVDKLNDQLIVDIKDSYRAYGLVRSAMKGTEKINYDSKDQVVFIDDTTASFLYHKLINERYSEIQIRGKNKVYNATAEINIICYSKFDYFHDHILNRLSKLKHVTITSSDFDAYKIIKEETGKSDFDFKNYLFMVTYQLVYKIDYCPIVCQ